MFIMGICKVIENIDRVEGGDKLRHLARTQIQKTTVKNSNFEFNRFKSVRRFEHFFTV